MIKAAIFGYGTVGSGVYEVLTRNSAMIQGKLGDRIEVKYVLDLREFPGDPVQDVLVHDVNTILDDEEVSIICETMGGEKPAYDFTRRALELGKSVCTSNKELVEKHGAELLKIAQEHHCSYLFEASVGGGIPIIRPLCTSLAQEHIESITGILNGTTNYILSKMENEGADFETVLKRAQEKGYAERNPEADVCGYDAGRKIAILTSLAYGKNVDFADLYVEGITQITRMDFAYAKKLGTTIKLFAKSQCIDGKYYAMVAPFMVTADNPLYAVQNVFNAILVHGNMVGDTMYYGKGAGKLATASAVVADVIDCAKHLGKHVQVIWEEDKLEISPMDDFTRRFFVRVKGTDRAQITENFGKVEFIDSVAEEETGFITSEMTEKAYEECAKKAGNVINRIRFEN
ncbi:MAG: homoserine dehydrogenase [Roseburia sp.]|jgi:homoserine dehydrogenase|nr:homoserine dehydrogenase [Roseburia sp.]